MFLYSAQAFDKWLDTGQSTSTTRIFGEDDYQSATDNYGDQSTDSIRQLATDSKRAMSGAYLLLLPIDANTAPTASNVSLSGAVKVGYTLTGSYSYGDADSDTEGTSTFRWLRYDDAGCTTGETVVGTSSTSHKFSRISDHTTWGVF